MHLLIGDDDAVRTEPPPGVALHRYRRFGRRRLPLLSSLQGRRALRSTLSRIEPDILHAHYITRHGWQGRLSGFHPLVVSPWGSDLFVTPRSSLRARVWARLTLRGADLVTVVSDHMTAAVRAHGVAEARIERVLFGVDTERFAPGGDRAALDALRIGAGQPFIFAPRAIRPIYRPDVAVEAFSALPASATLVMTTRNADPATLADVHRRVERHQIADRIRLVDDISDDLMLTLFQQAEMVISIPESDAIPISVLEAMACARPVIATDLPGPRERLGVHAPDLLVPIGDVPATAAAMHRVLAMAPGDRARLGDALRRDVVENADRGQNMMRMEALYFRLRDDR